MSIQVCWSYLCLDVFLSLLKFAFMSVKVCWSSVSALIYVCPSLLKLSLPLLMSFQVFWSYLCLYLCFSKSVEVISAFVYVQVCCSSLFLPACLSNSFKTIGLFLFFLNVCPILLKLSITAFMSVQVYCSSLFLHLVFTSFVLTHSLSDKLFNWLWLSCNQVVHGRYYHSEVKF